MNLLGLCSGVNAEFSPSARHSALSPKTFLLRSDQFADLAALVEGLIEYDTLSGKILNSKPVSNLLHRKFRKGWPL